MTERDLQATPELVRAVFAGYVLPWDGIHGLRHWGRVFENGMRLGSETGADLTVVEMFALFHDCRRVNEGLDRGHGLRGAGVAAMLRDSGVLDLTDEQFDLLHYACEHHTGGMTEGDPTVQTCWDADRLDLARVWITPDPRYLCTRPARTRDVREWAIERSRSDHHTPVVDTWLQWTGETV